MNKTPITMTAVHSAHVDYISEHKREYIQSGGTRGHIVDVRWLGGLQFTTHLLLETIGRKSGDRRIVPLIYGNIGGEIVVAASKGGADTHPAWYLNLQHTPQVLLQIASQAFRATWREPKYNERSDVWAVMDKLYPPYVDYRAATKRQIPLVLFQITTSIPAFEYKP